MTHRWLVTEIVALLSAYANPLPPIVGAADLLRALAAVVHAMSRGVISAAEVQAAAVVLEHHRKAGRF